MEFFGFLQSLTGWSILIGLVVALMLGFAGAPLIIWAVATLLFLVGLGVNYISIGVVAVIFAIFVIKPIRANTITALVMSLFKKLKIMPEISQTERTALDAGVVWVEKDLFSGKPDFDKLMKEPYPELTAEEKAFIDGPVERLCKMCEPWKVWRDKELPKEVWDFVRKEKFLGMIIPKEYGGLGFSALCHSEVIMKISSRSLSLAITVMVPNSLGPAELLVHYGTDKQKEHYLRRLSAGLEMPCFGLTEPMAGSDAGGITSAGVVFKGQDGKLKLKLNWNKRWITLAAVSSVIGLAFRLRDPENLLGKGDDVGITCALIPATTPGVVIGRRHDPLTIPFHNCPTQGHDVVVDLEECVVGGAAGAGEGWKMLMECLAAGRGISLPAQATGGAKLVTRVVSAHSVVRRQFGVSIGKFEGVEEPLARITASTYALEAMRRYTLGALDKGIKPPVITAIQKYYSTEMGRDVINDGMDIMGGAGISLGPRNLLAEIYVATPIGITVEGANILTRTLIVFGQGALRAHPFAYQEVMAMEANDLKKFDVAFWGHMGHIVRNLCRSIVLSWTRGYLAFSPSCHPQMKVYFRRLQWASASFAILTDVAMGALGGDLKRREKITGRFADILAHMYIATCVLRRFEADGRREEDLSVVHYHLKLNLSKIQEAFDGLFDNLKIPGLRWFLKGWIGAWSRINSLGSLASDGWSHVISTKILEDSDFRDRLTTGIYMPKEKGQQIERLENAFKIVLKSENAEKKIKKAIRESVLPKKKIFELLEEAKSKNVITDEELRLIKESDSVRFDAILVDDFDEDQYHNRKDYP
ncbi:MAG: acyl-CoA dehydrogenase [Bdellovibrio sp. 28-41-41]|nr:MAG: acyl-CoA dehydrogenase [Bdellovibrio sp. 28-41-41]